MHKICSNLRGVDEFKAKTSGGVDVVFGRGVRQLFVNHTCVTWRLTWPGLAIMSATVTPSISFNSQFITKVVKKSTEY